MRGAIVLVSHDRGLLDALCTRILHLEDGKITDFTGNYAEYRAELERRRAFQQFEYDQYRGEQARLRASIQDNRERSSQRRKPSERWGNSEARLHKMDGRQNSEKYHKARRQMESRLNHMEVKTRPARGYRHYHGARREQSRECEDNFGGAISVAARGR